MKFSRLILVSAAVAVAVSACKSQYEALLNSNDADLKYEAAFAYFNDGKYMEGCIGRPMKNSTVEVTPEGNIIVSGLTVMSGYVADEESTRKVLKNGKIYSADLGYVDEAGLIHLKGRQGDVINVGGFKVDPVEVENAASSFAAVEDCICIADTHPVVGTVLKLLVVTKDDAELDRQALARHLKSRLDPHKVPLYYEKVSSVMRTYNGKLDRKYYRKQN